MEWQVSIFSCDGIFFGADGKGKQGIKFCYWSVVYILCTLSIQQGLF